MSSMSSSPSPELDLDRSAKAKADRDDPSAVADSHPESEIGSTVPLPDCRRPLAPDALRRPVRLLS